MPKGQATKMATGSATNYSANLRTSLERVVKTLESRPAELRGPFKINASLASSGKK